MSRYKQGYNATDDVVRFILAKMDEFYASHPDNKDHFLLYFKEIFRRVIKAWKKRMMNTAKQKR